MGTPSWPAAGIEARDLVRALQAEACLRRSSLEALGDGCRFPLPATSETSLQESLP